MYARKRFCRLTLALTIFAEIVRLLPLASTLRKMGAIALPLKRQGRELRDFQFVSSARLSNDMKFLAASIAAGLFCCNLTAGERAFAAEDAAGPPAATSGVAGGLSDTAVEETIKTADGEVRVTLPPGTKSVLKQPAADEPLTVKAGYDSGLVPVPSGRVVDPAVKQAGGPSSGSTASGSGTTGANTRSAEDDAAAQAAAAAAAELMDQGLTSPKEGKLAGRPTTLLELIGRVGNDRSRQIWIVRDYWKLSAAQADYNWATDELARLEQVSAAKGLESTVLAAAQAAAQARLREAQIGAISAQQELADLVAITDKNQNPLAADPPLVGPYRTYFETLYANRAPPPRTRAIDRSLPVRLDAIGSRYAAVQAASSSIRYAEEARSKGQTDLQTLLNCHSDLAKQRRAFLATVRDYNLDIGEYAIAVADPGITNERLVAMLILVKQPATLGAVGKTEPTLATPSTADDPLFERAQPFKTSETAKGGVRRTGADK